MNNYHSALLHSATSMDNLHAQATEICEKLQGNFDLIFLYTNMFTKYNVSALFRCGRQRNGIYKPPNSEQDSKTEISNFFIVVGLTCYEISCSYP